MHDLRKVLGVLIAMAAISAAAPSAYAQVDAAGFRGMYRLEGKQIPLPEGVWQVAGRGTYEIAPEKSGGVVVSVALVRLAGGVVDAAILIQTNRLDGPAGWGKPAACERGDLYFASIRYASDHDGSCAYASYVRAATGPGPDVDPAWSEAMRLGAGAGWRMPRSWLQAAYRISDPRDVVQLRYLFDGASAEAAGPDAVRAIVGWTEASWRVVGSGFRNRLDTEAPLRDWRAGERAPTAQSRSLSPVVDEATHIGAKMVTASSRRSPI